MASHILAQLSILTTDLSRSCHFKKVEIRLFAGNRCVMGDKLSLSGKTVTDCHAEVIARRGLVRYFYRELISPNNDPKFILSNGK